MIKNPYINALAAGAYIVSLVLVINLFGATNTPETILMPMVALTLLVLSVALMAVLFFYQPVKLFLEGNREEALKFFTKTIVTFALLAALLIMLMLLVPIPR